jgi:Protein of unknown function C-terminus (DUF2399)
MSAGRERIERLEERDGIRYRIVAEPRVRHPDKLLFRFRLPAGSAYPDTLLVRLDREKEAMARRVLREGARGWRFWSTLRRHAGPDFSPFLVESDLLDLLVREAGLLVEDRYRNRRWVVHRFRLDESVRPWLGVVDPDETRAELQRALTQAQLLAALAQGPPRGMSWGSFDFCLRAAEELADLAEHGVRPGARELAGRIDHTKAWTRPRRVLVGRLLGRPFNQLVAHLDRPIEVKGPLVHRRGDLWASDIDLWALEIDKVELGIEGDPRGVVLVENQETFRSLLPLADVGYIVFWVPGGPPPAEVSLARRLSELGPGLRFHACFDLDPAGIRIASLLAERAEIELEPTGMTPELFASARRKLKLNAWDLQELARLDGRVGPLEPLRAAIAAAGEKAEQEPVQRQLYDLFEGASRGRTPQAPAQ